MACRNSLTHRKTSACPTSRTTRRTMISELVTSLVVLMGLAAPFDPCANKEFDQCGGATWGGAKCCPDNDKCPPTRRELALSWSPPKPADQEIQQEIGTSLQVRLGE